MCEDHFTEQNKYHKLGFPTETVLGNKPKIRLKNF